MTKPIANYKNWNNKLQTIENPGLNLSVQSLRDNSYENYVFDDLQFYAEHHIPEKVSRDTLSKQLGKYKDQISVDDGIRAWCEHDALHYLSQQPFTKRGEECVTYLEKKFNRGWLPLGIQFNPNLIVECDDTHITQELIVETAELIRGFYE